MSNKESFLLGQITARILNVHDKMIQAQDKEALTLMNDTVRFLKEEVKELYYELRPEENKE